MKRPLLLLFGVTGIVAVAVVPHARRAIEARDVHAEQAAYEDYIAAKEKEIECLERLTATGLPKDMDVQAELERCREITRTAEDAMADVQGD
jgi:alpha-D-ribose 1-methylphosphonate 5-triphosphate synthase subunit PhnI